MKFIAAFVVSAMFFTGSASGQEQGACGQSLLLYAADLAEPSQVHVSVTADIRGLSPIKPSIVFNISVPPGTASWAVDGEFTVQVQQAAIPLPLAKAEYWVLSPGNRVAVQLSGFSSIASQSQGSATLYKFYLAIPVQASEQFTVRFPALVSAGGRIETPNLLFRRISTAAGLELCGRLPR